LGGGHLSAVDVEWREGFTNDEVNALHAATFGNDPVDDDWLAMTARHSAGWATARADGLLVGFVNVVWDGQAHAWLQDVIVAPTHQRRGIGSQLVAVAEHGAAQAGCEWLHVDFDREHTAFYVEACGFTSTPAGIKRL
jgi:ribosomal protein S18 acetylase RimI-like enzyme